ncbi:WG repeat-containing protein [Campylobacter lari]|nr:WG repeat-containing protein [Campylobacter lari]
MIVEPKFDSIVRYYRFSKINKNEKWGLLDSYGKIAIEPKFNDVTNFSEGLAGVKLNDKWGFIDKNDKVVIKPKFDDAWGFSKGLAEVLLNGKWVYIDKKGNIISND